MSPFNKEFLERGGVKVQDVAKSTSTSAAKPKSSMFTRSPEAAEKTKPSLARRDDKLFGTGLRKRELEKTARDVAETQDSSSEDSEAAKRARDSFTTGELRNTQMDLSGARLDSSQVSTVLAASLQKYACIIGAAGTGKTTVVRTVINAWALAEKGLYNEDLLFNNLTPSPSDERFKLDCRHTTGAARIAVVSFTGRAVQNIQRALPDYLWPFCKTIHSLLEYAPTDEWKEDDEHESGGYFRTVFRPRRTAMNPLELDFLVMDEDGMTPIPLWNELWSALPSHCRIIKLGDIYQLAPVHGHSCLGFAMLAWPSYELQQVHRQTDGNGILECAHSILQGKLPKKDPKRGVHILEVDAGSITAANQIKGIVKKLTAAGKFDPLNDAIIVPTNKYDLGQEELNQDLVLFFNKTRRYEDKPDGAILNPRIRIRAGFETVTIAVGDKIMATKNDWDAGISNGMLGTVKAIYPNTSYRGSVEGIGSHDHEIDEYDFDPDEINIDDMLANVEAAHSDTEETKKREASHVVEVQFQNLDIISVFHTAGAINSLNLGYVFTCHKAQGGEYNQVAAVCHQSAKGMLSREWLYTAVTRAKDQIILLVTMQGLTRALRNQAIKGKTLEDKAKCFIALTEDKNYTPPILPEPIEIGLPEQTGEWKETEVETETEV